MKRILLILGSALTLAIAAACGPGANPTSTFPTNTTGPTLAPTTLSTSEPTDMSSGGELPSATPY